MVNFVSMMLDLKDVLVLSSIICETKYVVVQVQPLVCLFGAHLCLGMVDRVVLDHTKVPKYEVQRLQRNQESWQVIYIGL